ncbi:hypothetical protein B0O80DRAFT_429020 [Mortierella sp. GBAus27b]|nr:hypothetical protein B0O80DRAFT_429020 [Mortierella sp. GBAus27b]
MEPTQPFRLVGSTDILKIPCDQEDGQDVIFWSDILHAFPGAQYVKNGDTLVKMVKDACPDRNKPCRIRHYPGVILDVVISTAIASAPADSAIKPSNLLKTCGRSDIPTETKPTSTANKDSVDILEIPSVAEDTHLHYQRTEEDPKTTVSLNQVAKRSEMNRIDSGFERRLVSSMPFDMQSQVLGSSDVHGWIIQAIKNGQIDQPNDQLIACLQDLKDEMTKNNEMASRIKELVSDVKELATKNNDLASKNNELVSNVQELTSRNMESAALAMKLQQEFNVNQDEMKKLQIQTLDQLSLLQNRVQALMTQTYELHEYPIPRLFVVLPQDTSSWNPKDFLTNRFRLYFLCECGEHTKQNASKIPHYIHLAKHEGYEITRPKEFFQRYGRYVLTILKMLRLGVSVVGVAVPAVALLVRTDALDRATSSLKMLIGNLQTGMDQTIGCLEKATTDSNDSGAGTMGQLDDHEALEGADLRSLGGFLKNKDGSKVFGNLYRTTTSEGHVKWVCIDHYRENYHEKTLRTFRDIVESMGGSYDENVGRVSVHIRSKIQAEQFYVALDKAKSVYELEIGLDWDTTCRDFKKLRDCLIKSNVGALCINFHRQDGPVSDFLNRGKRHDPILDIMRHPSTRSITILGAPDDFIQRSSPSSLSEDFSNLRILEIDLAEFRKEISGLRMLLPRMTNLTGLTMNDSGKKANGVCSECGTAGQSKGSLIVLGACMKIVIRSRVHSELITLMMETSNSLYGLEIDLHVDLRDDTCDRGSEERVQLHKSIVNIMQHPSTRSVVILGVPGDFIQTSSLLSTNGNFPNLTQLRIDLSASERDISGLKTMVSRMPNLMCLSVNDSEAKSGHICCMGDTVKSPELSFEAIEGRAKIHLRSRLQAELVHQVLECATLVCGLDGIDIRVDLKDGSTSAPSDCIRGHDSILDIMRHPSARSVTIIEQFEDFIQYSSLLSQEYDFPNVKHLCIDLSTPRRDIPGLKSLVSRMVNLNSLTVNNPNDKSNDVQGSPDAVDALGRSFEINNGRVSIRIRSRIQLDLVHQALGSLQSIYGLDMDVHVDVKDIDTGSNSDRIQRHDSILDIMRHPCTHSATITGAPKDFIQQSSLVYRDDEFSSMKYFDLDLTAELVQDIPGLKTLLSRMPNLTRLSLDGSQYRKAHDHDTGSTAASLKRSFELDGGRVKIHLRSGIQAELISHMLVTMRSISGIDFDLHVEMDDSSTTDIHDGIKVYDSIFDIMRHPSTRTAMLVRASAALIRHSMMLSRDHQYPHLNHFDLSLPIAKHDVLGIKSLLSRFPNLNFLRINDSDDRNTHIEIESKSMETLDEPLGVNILHVKLHLGSKELMELADQLLAKVTSTKELDVGLYWNIAESDFEWLRDILAQTNVNTMKLQVNMGGGSNDDRHDSFFSVMRHPSVQSVTIMQPSIQMVQHPALLSCDDKFSSLRFLDIDLSSSIKGHIAGLKYLVAKAPNLSSLTFHGDIDDLTLIRVYIAVAEHQKYPITFGSRSLCIPPLTIASPQPLAAHQYLNHLLDVGGPKIDEIVLEGSADEEGMVDAIANVEGQSIGLKNLKVGGKMQGGQYVQNVARIVSRSELPRLWIDLRGEEERVQILESIQWKHIRSLSIRVDRESVETRAMKALVEGRDKEKGQVELDYFEFWSHSFETVSSEFPALCKSFVASTSIENLYLWVHVTPSDMESVLKSMDMSRLRWITLWPEGYSSNQVDCILDCLNNAHNLQKVWLYLYDRTQEQIQRMKVRGVEFF